MYPRNGGEKVSLVCRGCGHVQDASESEGYKLVREGKPKEEPAVIEERLEGLPETSKECPECGHGKAYWWMEQTRGADEPPTRFYRCAKCDHVWREYS